MIKNIVIGILIIAVFILIYFVYIFYSDKNDLIKNIQDMQNKNILLKSKIVEINNKIILLDLPNSNKDEKDNIDNLKHNTDKLLDEYKILNNKVLLSSSKINQYNNDLKNLRTQLSNIKTVIKSSNIEDKYFTDISSQEVKDIADDLIIIINKYINNTNNNNINNNTNNNNNNNANNNNTNNNTNNNNTNNNNSNNNNINNNNTNNIIDNNDKQQFIDIMNTINTILQEYNNSGINFTGNTYNDLRNLINNNTEFINSINTKLNDFNTANNNKTTNDLSKLLLTSFINKKINNNLDIILDNQTKKINELITINMDLKNKLISLTEFDPILNINIEKNDNLLNKDFSKRQGFDNINKIQGFDNPPNADDILFLKNYIKSSKYSLDKGIQLLNSNFSQTPIASDSSSRFTTINNFINLINTKINAYNSLLNLYKTINKNIISIEPNNTYIPVNKLHGIIFLNRTISGNTRSTSVSGGNRLLSIGDCLNNTPECYAYTNTESGNWFKRNLLNNIDNDMQLKINNNALRHSYINEGNYISSIQLINNGNEIPVKNNITSNNIIDTTKVDKYYDNIDILKHVLITNTTINENDVEYIDSTKNEAYFYYPNQSKPNNCIAEIINNSLDTNYNADGAVMGQYNGNADYSSGPWCKKFKIKSSVSKIRLIKSADKSVYIYNPYQFDYSAI